MIRPTFVDLSLVELNYYPFVISLDKYVGSCNSVDGLSTKICVPSKTKDVNVKLFNMLTNRNETRAILKHFSCDFKCKFNSSTCNSNQKWNNETCQGECKSYRNYEKDYYKNGKYLQSIADDSKNVYDEIIYVMNVVSTNMTNTIATNTTSTVSINCHNKKT